MKFSITREVLLKNLGYTQSVVEKRSSIAILSNVKLEAKDGNKLVTTATDNDIAVQGTADAFVETAGVTTVSAHKLYEIVRKLPEGVMVSAELSKDGDRLALSAGKARFSLACLDAAAFPDMTTASGGNVFKLKGDLLKRMLTKAQFAASQEDTRQYLNGVYMHVTNDKDKKLRFVATDGHRLARVQAELPEGADGMPGVIIPRKTVGELRKLCEDSKELSLRVTDKKIQFETPELVLTSKVIDGTFPDYERVIPSDNKSQMSVSRQSLMQAVDRVAILSHEKSRSIKFSLKPNHLTISANNPDQENAVEDLRVDYSADAMDVGFNAKYVSEIGALVEGEDVAFFLKDSTSPVLLRDPKDADTLFVLMPMRI